MLGLLETVVPPIERHLCEGDGTASLRQMFTEPTGNSSTERRLGLMNSHPIFMQQNLLMLPFPSPSAYSIIC